MPMAQNGNVPSTLTQRICTAWPSVKGTCANNTASVMSISVIRVTNNMAMTARAMR